MARTVVQKIKGHHYLYEVRSEWDPDTGKMKQRRKYIGRCDASGNLLSGKARGNESLSFGPYYLASQVAERCGLPGALEEVFGPETGRYMTAMAIVRMMRLTSPVQIVSHLRKSFLMQMYGLGYSRRWSDTVAFIERVTEIYAERMQVFRLLAEGDFTEILELDSLDSEFRFLDLMGSDYGFNAMPRMKVYLAQSAGSKLPFYFTQVPSGVSRLASLPQIVEDLDSMRSKGNSFFFNTGDLDAETALGVLGSGFRATFRMSEDEPFGRILMDAIGELNDRDYVTRMLRGKIYRVCERDVRIDGIVMRAIVVIDEKRRNGEIRTLHGYVDEILALSEMDDVPVADRIRMAHRNDYTDVLDAFEIHETDGSLSFELDDDALFGMEQKCGRILMATSDERGWDELMGMSHHRDVYEHDLALFKTDLEEGAAIFPSTKDAVANIMDDFIALRIRSKLQSMIEESPSRGRTSYYDILAEMGNIWVTRTSGGWTMTDYDEDQKAMLEALGIEVPTQKTIQRYGG